VLRTAVSTQRRRRRAVSISVLAVLFALSLSACSASESDGDGDKAQEALNFSAASAADAGVYGLSDAEPGTEDEGTEEETPPSEGEDEYASFGTVSDATGAISMEVPTEWSDVLNSVPAEGAFQAGLAASPDFNAFNTGWEIPGVNLRVSKSLGEHVASSELPEIALGEVHAAVSPRDLLKRDCDPAVNTVPIGGTGDNVFTATLGDLVEFGVADIYSNCGGNGAAFADLAALSTDRTSVLYMQIQLVRQADLGATSRLLSTLQIDYTKVPIPGAEQEEPELVVP
jgi:hypothetical protein